MPRRMGRPGLVGTMARTAVIAGTATATAGAVSRHQQGKAQEKQQAAEYEAMQQQQMMQAQAAAAAPPPAASAGPSDEAIQKLKELAELKSQGIITEAEFEVQKAKLLA